MTTRRRFIKATAINAIGLSLYDKAIGQSLIAPDHTLEHGDALQQFPYGQVSFETGIHRDQLENTHSVLMSLNEDSLLKPYRLVAGLPAPGCDLGGWYSERSLEAQTFGQWISALARYHAITGDEATREKVRRLVQEYSLTVEPTEAALPKAGERLYARKDSGPYLYNNITCGLMDAYQFTRDPKALDVLSRATKVIEPYLPARSSEDFDSFDIQSGFSWMVPENQFIVWQLGGDSHHLELGRRFLLNDFFEPLARGVNVLPGRHAYSHVDALCSSIKAYLVLGDEKYLRAAANGFGFIQEQSFASGGWGPNESFLPSLPMSVESDYTVPGIATLAEAVDQTHRHFETVCGSYAHFKLTRYLLRITKKAKYGDSMESVMYNTVLGASPLQKNGRAFYQSDYSLGATKTYYDGYGGPVGPEWPCCSGTLGQIAADYYISTYFRDSEGVLVNLYIPSTVNWQRGSAQISMTQSGSYPIGSTVSFEMTTSQPAEFTLKFRIPSWATQAALSVNGKSVNMPLKPGTFASLRRTWHTGDRIDLELPHGLELRAVDAAHPDTVAVVYGPLVLFAVSGSVPKVSKRELLTAKQQRPEGHIWRVETADGAFRLMPFWAIEWQRYSMYLKTV